MDTFQSAFDEKVRPLMDKIDQVRSLLPDNYGITFPNVVVVGDQSSGKSTLLESLSLVELPKGSGIVTRCPLVLRLRASNERRVFRLLDNEKILLDETQLNIMNYIEEETTKLAGQHKNVVKKLIELQVEDPNVRNLTVVDLPGIARNPIADQPKDIHKQTTDLIRHYISQDGCIILCVFPANVDVATVESFTLAREVDPEGIRTIGVMTKSDLAPNKDLIIQQLLMVKTDVLYLKLGFIAVRNRTTDEKMSLECARKREKEFFADISSDVGYQYLGVDALIKRLANLYSQRVKDMFPKIKADIRIKLIATSDQLRKFPLHLDSFPARLAKYHELVDLYVENILKVRFERSSDGLQASLLNALHIEFKKFEVTIDKHKVDLISSEFRTKVRAEMEKCFGEQLPNFLPHPVLKRLLSEKINVVWDDLKILIKTCFHKSLQLVASDDIQDYNDNMLLKKLLPLYRNIAASYIEKQKRAVKNKLLELVNLEKNDPYTMNHYYMDTVSKFKNKQQQQSMDADENAMFRSISNEDQAVQEMLISLFAYWKVLTKRFMDYVAKYIRNGCVFDICGGIRERLRSAPAEQSELVDKYLTEDEFTREQRIKCQHAKVELQKIYAILGDEHLVDTAANGDCSSDENDSDVNDSKT